MDYIFNINKNEPNIAIVDDRNSSVTYGCLVRSCGTWRELLGCDRKKLILVLAENNIETILCYLAAIQNNHTVILSDADLDDDSLNRLIDVYKPDFIWGPSKNNHKALYRYKNYELISFEHSFIGSAVHPDLALMLSTSGSTGSPKMVKLTKKNLNANAKSIAQYLNLDKTERPITCLPVHYTYGLSIINSHLLVGATILLTELSIVKKEFWNFFNAKKGTSLSGIPYSYEMLKKIGFPGMDLPTLRYMTQAGGKMDAGMVLEYANLSREKKFDFFVMYGQTEATARISYLPPEYNILKAGSIGQAIPGGKIILIDESGSIITEPNRQGQLVYQGQNVMMGYAFSREDLGKEPELSGTLETGDIAMFDEDGFFYITGRKSRFIKIFGKRVSLTHVEEHLKEIGYKCYCGGLDDRLLIASMNKEEFHKIRKEIFIKFKIPPDLVHLVPVQNIPRNSYGKIDYHTLFNNESTTVCT